MAEQLLDDSQRGAPRQLRRPAVAEAVRSKAQVKAGDLTVGLHQALDLANRQPAVSAILKQWAVRLSLKPAHFEEVDQVEDGLTGGVI